MLHWAQNRFRASDFAGREEELESIMRALKEV
jgi:hypothetical protein